MRPALVTSFSLRPIQRLFLAGLLASAAPAFAGDFVAEAKAWADQHTEIFEQAAKLTDEGYPTDGHQILLALAEEDQSPQAAFVIAKTLYSFDPAASYRLHFRAQQSLPNEPLIDLEVALEQHRRGEYAAAISNYRRFLASGKGPQYSALLADCLLRTRQLPAAVQAWYQAGHATHSTEIDVAICAVYGPLSPAQRRGDLIAKIEAGDTAKITDLILLDLAFDSDWWNSPVNDEALDADLKRANQVFGRKNGRYQALTLYAKLARRTVKKQSEIQKTLKDAQLVIGPGAMLPEDSQIARALCELAVNAHLITPTELWVAFEAPLHARLAQKDRDALHLLCWLAAATHNQVLTDLDRLGWEEWNDPAFAGGLMVDLYREKKLTSPNDSQILAALAVAPDNSTLIKLRLALAGDDVTNDLIIAGIKVEYRKLSGGDGQHDSSTLNALFDALGKRL